MHCCRNYQACEQNSYKSNQDGRNLSNSRLNDDITVTDGQSGYTGKVKRFAQG
jgi:hypothetical protein